MIKLIYMITPIS